MSHGNVPSTGFRPTSRLQNCFPPVLFQIIRFLSCSFSAFWRRPRCTQPKNYTSMHNRVRLTDQTGKYFIFPYYFFWVPPSGSAGNSLSLHFILSFLSPICSLPYFFNVPVIQQAVAGYYYYTPHAMVCVYIKLSTHCVGCLQCAVWDGHGTGNVTLLT